MLLFPGALVSKICAERAALSVFKAKEPSKTILYLFFDIYKLRNDLISGARFICYVSDLPFSERTSYIKYKLAISALMPRETTRIDHGKNQNTEGT